MPASVLFKTKAAAGGVADITYLGLVDAAGVELTGGSYARKAVTWVADGSGGENPTADLTFDIPAGATVGGWKGFDALTSGGDYGGVDYDPADHETYANAGQYVLQAAATSYTVA